MKGKFTKIMAALALLVFMTPSLAGWGQTRTEVTWTASEQGYENAEDVTSITIDENIGGLFSAGTNTSNSPKYYTTGSGVRMYNNNTLTITPDEGYTITGIVFTYSASSYLAKFEVSVGDYSENGTTGTWTGTSSQAIVFTAKATCRMQSIAVNYTSGTVTPTYTVTYNANGGSGEMIDENSPYEEDDEVTLLENTFTAPEGMLWSAWQVKDAENNDITVTDGTFMMPASNVTVTAQWVADPNVTQYEWVLTDLADLTSDDIFVIVGNNGSNYAMTNNNGTSSAPTASSVTVASERITSIVDNNVKWNISGNATDGYTFYPNGSTDTWLYCTNTNNGVRVGNNDNKTFEIKDDYLYHTGTSRYVGVYNSSDWRCYTSINSNISGQSFAFYKRQVVNTDPYIIAEDVELEFDATEGTITYELHNATGDITATTDAEWITSLTPNATNSTVAIICEANPSIDPREAIVVLAFGDATKEVTVSQAFNPNAPLSTMDQIFERATEVGSTATDVTITFNNWVVSATSNNNAYVTDGNKGFIIYASSHGFEVGNVLSGTVSCKVQLFRGSAELTMLTSESEGLTVEDGGTVSPADIAISELSGVNTGALLSYENLIYNGSALVDGNGNTITPFTTFYSYEFESNHIYNVAGIYVQYNSTKEILPRDASDVDDLGVALSITGYGEGSGNWYLVASPVSTTPEAAGMITDDGTDPENLSYDLYYYDHNAEDGLEWRNYRTQNFNLEPGTGYLYANKNDVTLTFTGTAYEGDGSFNLVSGWNLVGNPFAATAYIGRDFYTMNPAGSELIACTTSNDPIEAMHAVFVEGGDEDQVTFSTTAPEAKSQIVALNVTKNRGTAIDRAIVRFDEGQQLPKFQLNPENTKLYIAQGDKDYAIVRSAAQGEMPISFRAAENGTYTLSIETENVEMDYLHLIDNMTGADVDLLATPNYTFEATTRDYASRFRLVFSANEMDGPSTGSGSFAYFNGSEWQISNIGEATLQVVDVMGRIVKNVALEGNATVSINEMPGVYMMRLLNGNDVKVQKVVVR